MSKPASATNAARTMSSRARSRARPERQQPTAGGGDIFGCLTPFVACDGKVQSPWSARYQSIPFDAGLPGRPIEPSLQSHLIRLPIRRAAARYQSAR